MKLPRDISGNQLIKNLKPLGYIVTRQTGSHIRLSTEQNSQHRITSTTRSFKNWNASGNTC